MVGEAKDVVILPVEDNPADVRLTEEALREGRIANEVHVAADGDAALAYLRKSVGPDPDGPTPDLVLLDLALPGTDGREVLAAMRADPLLRRIPVVMLTASSAQSDVLRAYDLGVNCYVTKPVDLARFIEVVQSIEGFWFTVVRLPSPV